MSTIIHPSITQERVIDAVEAQMYGTANPGFCLACGADHDECEPDASGYTCYECDLPAVEGAQNVLMMIA